MIGVDTNILVHAHRGESPWNRVAVDRLAEAARSSWAIPWPCLHEFLAIVTHAKVFDPPTPLAEALKAVSLWAAAPTVRLLSELPGYFEILDRMLRTSLVSGPRVHDARIAALCVQHGVDELWSADRDFSRFAGLKVRNPLL